MAPPTGFDVLTSLERRHPLASAGKLETSGPRPTYTLAMDSGFNLATVLLFGSGLFCLTSLFFGTRGGYYDTDDYDGNGTAH